MTNKRANGGADPSPKKSKADVVDAALAVRCIDTVRVLSADMVEKAKSGHPGAPIGCAP
jgi:transketolase